MAQRINSPAFYALISSGNFSVNDTALFLQQIFLSIIRGHRRLSPHRL